MRMDEVWRRRSGPRASLVHVSLHVCVCACLPAFHHVHFLPAAEPKDSRGVGGWGGGEEVDFPGVLVAAERPRGDGLSRACWDIINTGPRGNPGDGRRSQPTRCCLLVDRRAPPRTGTAGWSGTCANQPSILTPLSSSSCSTTSPVDPISTPSHALLLLSHGCLDYFHTAVAPALCRAHAGGASHSPVIKKCFSCSSPHVTRGVFPDKTF